MEATPSGSSDDSDVPGEANMWKWMLVLTYHCDLGAVDESLKQGLGRAIVNDVHSPSFHCTTAHQSKSTRGILWCLLQHWKTGRSGRQPWNCSIASKNHERGSFEPLLQSWFLIKRGKRIQQLAHGPSACTYTRSQGELRFKFGLIELDCWLS